MATIAKPLLYEPGTSWSYGSAYIFIGKLVERASGLRLDRYFQQHIFDPLGAKSLTFYPTDEVKAASMAICARMPDQSVVALPPGAGVVRPTEVADIPTGMLLGGEGLFGTQRDFLLILRAVLQSNPSSPHRATNPILSASSFKELFTGCVTTEIGKQAIVDMFAPQGYFDPVISTANVDYTPGLLTNLEDFTGRRRAGSGCGYGILNTPFWIDTTTGIAVCSLIAEEGGWMLMSRESAPLSCSLWDRTRGGTSMLRTRRSCMSSWSRSVRVEILRHL
jgi:CubicO group peptidase (beta-lactamase class C family)